MENNTLELQLLSESCRALAISNVQTADPATDSFRVRDLHPIPLFSEQVCVSDLPREAGQSFHLDEATSVLRVAHVPQKPWYVILGTIAVVSAAQLSPYGSASPETFAFDLPTVLLPRFAQAKPG